MVPDPFSLPIAAQGETDATFCHPIMGAATPVVAPADRMPVQAVEFGPPGLTDGGIQFSDAPLCVRVEEWQLMDVMTPGEQFEEIIPYKDEFPRAPVQPHAFRQAKVARPPFVRPAEPRPAPFRDGLQRLIIVVQTAMPAPAFAGAKLPRVGEALQIDLAENRPQHCRVLSLSRRAGEPELPHPAAFQRRMQRDHDADLPVENVALTFEDEELLVAMEEIVALHELANDELATAPGVAPGFPGGEHRVLSC